VACLRFFSRFITARVLSKQFWWKPNILGTFWLVISGWQFLLLLCNAGGCPFWSIQHAKWIANSFTIAIIMYAVRLALAKLVEIRKTPIIITRHSNHKYSMAVHKIIYLAVMYFHCEGGICYAFARRVLLVCVCVCAYVWILYIMLVYKSFSPIL